ncbi:MAG: CvpA family protein [Acidobacteria bacterium]|nr:MAG: CvpA family protein [Acidobacteriota bacterium]RLE24631.1 MAG: CvpA family protein [Acidobacteriota bacterium]
MNWFDVTALAVLAVSAGFAFFKGFIREIASLAGLILASILAFRFYRNGAELLLPWIKTSNLRNISSFFIIFLTVILLSAIISYLLKRVFDSAGLSFYDRFLGLLFGILRGVVIVYVFVIVLQGFGMAGKTLNESRSYHIVSRTMGTILSFVPSTDKGTSSQAPGEKKS